MGLGRGVPNFECFGWVVVKRASDTVMKREHEASGEVEN